ncbi:MAG: TonB-dependent receptor [Saprospiraceae bacterium]
MKIINRATIAMLFSILIGNIFAQNIITGKVSDSKSVSYEFATVLLLNSKDSTLAKGAITDPDGKFEFENTKPGKYLFKISYVGKQDFLVPVFEYKGGQLEMGNQVFPENATELQTVTVTAVKPMIEINAEKMILNVADNVSSAGSDGFEILRKAPGVVIDNNDNITLKGKNGVQVYIDGKPARLGGRDLSSLLKSYNANNIEAIEVILNPSAKYEAEGNAGIINIRLKRNLSLGTNGSISANFRMGISPKGNLSLNLNHRTEKFNFYSNLAGGMGINHGNMGFYREQGGLFFDQNTKSQSDSVKYPRLNYRFGVDYLANKNHTFGFLINGNKYDGVENTIGRTLIGTLNNTGKIDSILNAQTRTLENRSNINFNANYAYKDSLGRTFNVDADYGMIRNGNNSFNPNLYMSPDETSLLSSSIFGSITNTDINIKTLKGDYEQDLLKGKLGLGFKLSQVVTDNGFDFFNFINSNKIQDFEKSSQFNYNEKVYATYANYNKTFNKQWALQAGLRLEATNSRGLLMSINPQPDDDVKRSYANLFPSFALTYNANKSNTFGFTYSRRIDRPRYSNLNPFEQRLDELAFRKGNPFLKPQFSHNFNLNHTLKGMVTTTLSFSRTYDFFGQIIDSTQRKRTFITEKNIAQMDNYSLGIASPLPLAKWYSGYVSLNLFRQVYNSDFGSGKNLSIGTNGFNIYSEHTASLKNGIKLQISGWYNRGGVWGGTFVNKGMGTVDLGLQKSIWNRKADIKLSFTDLFKTASWKAISDFGGIYFSGRGYNESQTFRVNFTYRFGNTKVKGARQRKTGLEDEQRRAGN